MSAISDHGCHGCDAKMYRIVGFMGVVLHGVGGWVGMRDTAGYPLHLRALDI
jgi:hypothetical protein